MTFTAAIETLQSPRCLATTLIDKTPDAATRPRSEPNLRASLSSSLDRIPASLHREKPREARGRFVCLTKSLLAVHFAA